MGQTWDPERYARNAAFVAALGEPLIGLLAPRAGEQVLDLGCGDGALSERLVAAGCRVTGVDASPEQVAAARARGLDARVANGERLLFDQDFDAVLSNAALHWMRDPDAVLRGVWRALRSGGRFVAEMGASGNVAGVAQALEVALARRGVEAARFNPWYFPQEDDYYGRLEAAGFRVAHMERFERPTTLPGSLADWLDTFGEPFLAAVPEDERAGVLRETCEAAAPRLRDAAGTWVVDYVRLRFVALKPRP